MTVAVSNHEEASLPLEQKHLLKQSLITHKCLLLFILLSIILVVVVICCFIWITDLRIQNNNLNKKIQYIRQSQTEDNQTIQNSTNKITHVLMQGLNKIKRLCLENSCSESETKPSDIFLKHTACLEACFKCVKYYVLASVSLLSS